MPPRRPPPPLDPERLERLALRYVERFQTTQAKLARYLVRKVRERGWAQEGPPDPTGVAARMAALGYIDDAAFAEAKAGTMTRRGLGARRIAGALREAGVGEADREALRPTIAAEAEASALAFARRRRIGPFAGVAPDRQGRERAIGQLLRAGHALDLARRIVDLPPGAGLYDPDTPARE